MSALGLHVLHHVHVVCMRELDDDGRVQRALGHFDVVVRSDPAACGALGDARELARERDEAEHGRLVGAELLHKDGLERVHLIAAAGAAEPISRVAGAILRSGLDMAGCTRSSP